MNKGLEALEKIKLTLEVYNYFAYENRKNDFNTIEKELKALEIIKKYFVFHHIGTDTGNKTFHIIATSEKLIPAEEYYLLKEVL